MRLASDKENKVEEQNIRPPAPIRSTPIVVLDSEEEIKEAKAEAVREEKKKSSKKAILLSKIREEYQTKWFAKKNNLAGFSEWYSKNRKAILQGDNIQIP